MPKLVTPLTNTKIQSAKPKEKLYKLSDGGGLALWIYPTGNKSWKLTYTRIDGKRDNVTLGSFPQFSLSDARAWREEMKTQISHGNDIKNNVNKTNENENDKNGFLIDFLFAEWIKRWQETVSKKYGLQVERAIYANCWPTLKDKDVREIKTFDIVQSLRSMEARGKLEYLKRTKSGLNLFFDDIVGQGIIETNPVSAIGKKVFKKPEQKHFDALTPDQLPDLIKWLETGSNEVCVKLAIYWQLLTMTRPAETLEMSWEELDLDTDLWVIPPERMKKKREHIIPITSAMKIILSECRDISVNKKYVFEGRDFQKPLSLDTPRIALRRAGLPTTAHGLRSLARTYLRENTDFRDDVLEMLLAHSIGTKTSRAYNRALLLNERREALEYWGEQIMKLRSKYRIKC